MLQPHMTLAAAAAAMRVLRVQAVRAAIDLLKPGMVVCEVRLGRVAERAWGVLRQPAPLQSVLAPRVVLSADVHTM